MALACMDERVFAFEMMLLCGARCRWSFDNALGVIAVHSTCFEVCDWLVPTQFGMLSFLSEKNTTVN
jgi:hypothetical protein